MMITRRFLIKGLVATPAVIQYGHLMPVQALPLPYLPGDLINFDIGTWKATGWSARCEPVRRIEGQYLIFKRWKYSAGNEEVRIHSRYCSLFHGLPGNRVNNPSMRHKLIRTPGQLGLHYPEDVGVTPSGIGAACRGEQSHAGGHVWEYFDIALLRAKEARDGTE